MRVLCTGWSESGECVNWSGEERVTEPVVSRHSPFRMLKVYVVERPGCKDFRDMREDTCSRFLIQFNIGASPAYKSDQKSMTRGQWEIIAAFRSGHVSLNGEIKGRKGTQRHCEHGACRGIRDVLHYVFECPKYNALRGVMIKEVREHYVQMNL